MLPVSRLQRKVLLLVLVIVLLPMIVTGLLSAAWIQNRMDSATERWIREAAQANSDGLQRLNNNGRLFADLYIQWADSGVPQVAGQSPVPAQLQPLARELGINLIQFIDSNGRTLYSSPGVALNTRAPLTQGSAVISVTQGSRSLLAAVTVLPYPARGGKGDQLVFGSLFDKELLNRLNRMSGLKTKLFYPQQDDFVAAFDEQRPSLRQQLSPRAYAQLQRHEDYYSAVGEVGNFRGLYTPILSSNGQLEAILFSGLEQTGNAMLSDRLRIILIVCVFGCVLAAAVGLLISRLVLRPVTYLHEAVMKIAAQDFRTSLPMTWRDEIGDLTRAFNSMVAKLRESRDEQRREFQRDKIASLGELSMALAHELRNPIGAINTASKLLDKNPTAERRQELQRVIHEECQRVDQFLKDFQQLARHRQPQFTHLDPGLPLEKALRIMLAGHDAIQLESRFNHARVRIRADAELLQQAWMNLVRNAIEAMQDKGTLIAGSYLEQDDIVVYLQDDGPGIPLELMTRLFEPFYTTKAEGSGLGLTLATTLVTASGASLELDPQIKTGTRFIMRFKVLEEE